MESLKENNVVSKESFFKYTFNFDSDSKNELLNLLQYTLTSFVLVVVLNKIFQIYIPEADESKHYATLIFEMLIQIIGLVLGMMIIHRIVSYIPTYSKIPYKQINMLNFVIPFLVILLSIQTKLGDKVNIIIESVSFFSKDKGPKPVQTSVKVSQPLSLSNAQQVNTNQSNVGSFQTTQLLPTPGMANTQIPDLQQQINNSSNNDSSVGPSENIFPESSDEPMAANAVLGLGSSF